MIRASGVFIVLLTNAVPAIAGADRQDRVPVRGGGEMRAFDCSDPSHGKVHFTGKDDDDLVQSIQAHAATAHPDLTEGQIREMVAGADWWKQMATSGANAGSAQSAYDE
jgi:predicted small metal-binding protein